MNGNGDMRRWTEPWQFKEVYPAPNNAVAHAIGTDVEEDVHVLYALVRGIKPRKIVELGTRQGTTARTLAFAANAVGATFHTVDPDPNCRPFIEPILHPEYCVFHQMTGEMAYEHRLLDPPDLLFVDTDPHTREQTKMWLETWVSNHLAQNAVVVFHDTIPARPEIQVADAVRDWLKYHQSWHWTELQTMYGLGILWKP